MKNNNDICSNESSHHEDTDFSDEKPFNPQIDSTISTVRRGERVHVL